MGRSNGDINTSPGLDRPSRGGTYKPAVPQQRVLRADDKISSLKPLQSSRKAGNKVSLAANTVRNSPNSSFHQTFGGQLLILVSSLDTFHAGGFHTEGNSTLCNLRWTDAGKQAAAAAAAARWQGRALSSFQMVPAHWRREDTGPRTPHTIAADVDFS